MIGILDKCKGLITRERKAGDNLERAVLDYVIICEEMKEFLENMTVDEERIYTLTKYTGKKSVKKTLSDHNVMIANFTLKFDRQPRKTRNEFFNFKNKENQQTFLEETSSSLKLSSCFSEQRSFEHNSAIFFKTLNGTFHKTFQKVRVTSGGADIRHGEESFQALIKLKKELEIFLLNTKGEIARQIAKRKLEETENLLTLKFSTSCADIIKENLDK